ncbi:TOX high mobility group box family member 4-A-like isoform X1 [Micropterus salmoides]|uniref:TOX high mobility group box family member 4-A-like isoform X1 n=1 Tax=Micropterus salmoides TaxID=27706 RepID=UPI0018EC752B|nr:TOX high mobility group box family member 4-A-like isoform X1 [Micropterus salmoides]XP_045908386.1 TOX high mobility group box family member 4-A isoform X1 [Micropterus dolomieu]
MDLNFYSDLSDGCAQSVDSEFLDTEAYGGYSEENKFPEGSDSYLTISGGGHPFLSAEQTFHTPSLGDEVFEIPPISLDPDPTLSISDAVAHFELTDGSDGTRGPSGSRSLVSNLVVEANDPSFASTFVSPGSQGLEQLNLGAMGQAGGGALLSSSALELGNSSGSHFSSSSPMTIDVQLGDIGHGLLGSSQLSTINQSELALGLGGENIRHHSETIEQPLSATPSPAGSLQDEDMDDFKRSVLVDSPMAFSSPSALSQMSSHPVTTSVVSLATARRGGGKPATLAPVAGPVGAKKGRKKKDPNEPQKPVSAYALFFRDTQAAIKGQNPNASFGEVSKIVASMWDSLAEEQKQVYKRKTEAAKKEYLKALAAYRANQLSEPAIEEMETAPSPPPPVVNVTPAAVPSAAHHAIRLANNNNLEENTITNICASNIILDIPERTTRSRTGANKASSPAAAVPPAQTITKIIIPKHMLQAGGQVVTVLPGGVRTLQPTLVVSGASRQPPPLQQMQNAPLPPRLQQMAPAPPPLQAKPREGSATPGLPVSITATPPPPLQIKIVPASLQGKEALPIIVPNTAAVSSTVTTSAQSAPMVSVQVVNSTDTPSNTDEDEVTEVLPSEDDEMEVNGSTDAATTKSVCVRVGCNNPVVESEDWDKEYCSNECVATHCRDIFRAWCSIRNQTMGTVK